MTSNGEMAVIVRYPTEFGSHVKLCLPTELMVTVDCEDNKIGSDWQVLCMKS